MRREEEISIHKKLKVKGAKSNGRPRFLYKSYHLHGLQAIFVVSMKDQEVLYQRNIQSLLGYEPHEFDYRKTLEIIHPEDFEIVKPVLEGTIEYSAQYGVPENNIFYISFRVKKKDGKYISIQQINGVCTLDQSKSLKCYYTILQDISYLRQNMGVRWFWDNPELKVKEYNKLIGKKSPDNSFTKRELDVFELLKLGKSSEEIGSVLNLSPNTVNTHRKNMLKKTGVNTSIELIQLFE